ncbi:hypothetical protein [Delftia sp. PS-11]|uniref:hypothetical protein n=1 Tax=Delftia sp. PS-11 TaxID=2767222 RepID=UPI002458FA3A|nr:hypothetical protein [Delftia sp. PS-11]KAJ8740844.1 hypothetical protein H9T68_22405 [Delftia sp. PS-11]
MRIYDFVKTHIVPFNSVIAMAITVAAVLDFLAPQAAYLAWLSYAIAGVVLLVIFFELLLQNAKGSEISWSAGLLNRLRQSPGPVWKSPGWQVVGIISLLAIALGQASKARAEAGGLIASALPNFRNVQMVLLGLREDTHQIQEKLETVDRKMDVIQASLESSMDDPLDRLMQGDYPYFEKRVQAGKGLPQHKLTLLWGLNKKRDDRIELLKIYQNNGMNLRAGMPISGLESGVAIEDALTIKNIEKMSAYAKKRFDNPLVQFFSLCAEMDLLVYAQIAGDDLLARWLIEQGLSMDERFACEFGGNRWTTSAREIQAILAR